MIFRRECYHDRNKGITCDYLKCSMLLNSLLQVEDDISLLTSANNDLQKFLEINEVDY